MQRNSIIIGLNNLFCRERHPFRPRSAGHVTHRRPAPFHRRPDLQGPNAGTNVTSHRFVICNFLDLPAPTSRNNPPPPVVVGLVCCSTVNAHRRDAILVLLAISGYAAFIEDSTLSSTRRTTNAQTKLARRRVNPYSITTSLLLFATSRIYNVLLRNPTSEDRAFGSRLAVCQHRTQVIKDSYPPVERQRQCRSYHHAQPSPNGPTVERPTPSWCC